MALNRRKQGGMARRMAVIFSLAGVVFCILAALGLTEGLCTTSGCALYREWSFLGLSLWWWGALGFGTLTALALADPSLARIVAGLALLADAGLLVAMALLAPCGNCLIAGAGFFFVWLCLRAADDIKGGAGALLTLLWIAALSPNIVALAGEGGGWPVYGDAGGNMRVYFSPSCPACRRAVFDLTSVGQVGVAYIPVSEVSGDIERIIAMRRAVDAGQPFKDAFRDAVRPDFTPVEHGFWEGLEYRMLLAHNHAVFRRMGARGVPFITSSGWRGLPGPPAVRHPGEPRPATNPAAAGQPAAPSPAQAAPGTAGQR